MMYIYDKQKDTVMPWDETEFKSLGLLERQDLERWIEKCPSILGEELMIITTEYDKFDKTNERLDLLGLDKDGNIVVIELKRDDSGKNVDLQALKYAAYCSTINFAQLIGMYARYQRGKGVEMTSDAADATIRSFIANDDFNECNDRPRIILVAKEFRPEVTASVIWLRNFDLDISCVKWVPYELENGRIAVSSTVLIPLPEAKDFLMQAGKKEIAEHTVSPASLEYVQFFSECVELLNSTLPNEYAPAKPRSYYQIPTGMGSIHFEWQFLGRPRSGLGVALHFEKGDKALNQKLLASCSKLKDKLQSALNEEVIIQESWGKNWARLYVENKMGEMTDELKEWAVAKMIIMIQILQPELDKLAREQG